MPVVINELEVVVVADEPAEPQRRGDGAQRSEEAGTAPGLGPMEVTLILERRAERDLRLFAH